MKNMRRCLLKTRNQVSLSKRQPATCQSCALILFVYKRSSLNCRIAPTFSQRFSYYADRVSRFTDDTQLTYLHNRAFDERFHCNSLFLFTLILFVRIFPLTFIISLNTNYAYLSLRYRYGKWGNLE